MNEENAVGPNVNLGAKKKVSKPLVLVFIPFHVMFLAHSSRETPDNMMTNRMCRQKYCRHFVYVAQQ